MLNRGRRALPWPKGLRPLVRMLNNARAPSVLGLLLTYLMIGMPPQTYDVPRYTSAEMFAGREAYSDAWREVGKPVVTFDLIKGQRDNDITSSFGFANHLHKLLEVDLVALMAPVCSTWCQLNRWTSQRTASRPLGRSSRVNNNANCMVSRVMLCVWLCVATGTCFILEQPARSFMEHHPRFLELFRTHKIFKKELRMKDQI